MLVIFLLLLLVLLLATVGCVAQPTITVGFIATTFGTDPQTGALRRSSDVGAQHLAAFMLAVDEINQSNEFSIMIRPEVSLGNVDYVKPVQNPTYDGSAAARDIYLSEFMPQVVIVSDTSTKALSATSALSTLGVPTIFSSDRSSKLSHANVYPEVIRMTASESHDAMIIRQLCRHYGWSRVGIIHSEDDFGVDALFVFKTQEMDGDTGDAIALLDVESFPTHQKDVKNEVAALLNSGATIFLAFISKASSMAVFLVQGYRIGLFRTGTQVVIVCQQPNVQVIAEVQKLLLPSEHIDDILQGLLSVQLYPQQHLSTPRGQDFLSRFRALPPTRSVVNGKSYCVTAASNRTVEHIKYPLYKVPQHPEICTGIADFSFSTENIDPDILLTYDATIAVAKALHYLMATDHYSNSSADLSNHLYEILVSNITNRLSIAGATGMLKWYQGYAKAEDFGQGERTTGHSYKIINYFPSSLLLSTAVNIDDGLAFTGFYNGTKDLTLKADSFIRLASTSADNQNSQDVIVLCANDDTTDGLPCQAARYRTSDSFTPPLDMRVALHIYSFPTTLKAIVAALGAVSAAAAMFCLVTLALFRTHHLVKYTQPPVLGFTFSGYLILSVKVLASQSTISPGYCVGDKWVGHLGFACAIIPLVVKLWRLDKIVNGKSLKKVKITDLDAVKICIAGTLALVLLLVVDSVVAVAVSPSSIFMRSRRELVRNQYTYTHFCGLSDHPASLALTGCIYAFQCAVLAKAMVFLWKTRQLPANVNEVGTLTPMVLAVTLLVVVTATLVGIIDFHPYTNSLIVNLACAFGVLLSVNYYWLPKCSAIYWDHHKKKIAAAASSDAQSMSSSTVGSASGGGWSVIKRNIAAAHGDLSKLDDVKKQKDLLKTLRAQQLPLPANIVQENIIAEIAKLKGSTPKAVFCQSQISYLQILLVALSQLSDSGNDSSSKAVSSNHGDSVTAVTAVTAENTKSADSVLATPSRDKPGSSYMIQDFEQA